MPIDLVFVLKWIKSINWMPALYIPSLWFTHDVFSVTKFVDF